MLKKFMADVHLDGHYTIENPLCPSEWRGSGCYDMEVPVWADIHIEVWAHSESEARTLLMEYKDYEALGNQDTIVLDAVQVESVWFISDLDEEDYLGVIEPDRFDWKN